MEGVLVGAAAMVSTLEENAIFNAAVLMLDNNDPTGGASSSSSTSTSSGTATSNAPKGKSVGRDSSLGVYGDGYAAARISCLIGRYLSLNMTMEVIPSSQGIGFYPENTISCGLPLIEKPYIYESMRVPAMNRHVIDPWIVKSEHEKIRLQTESKPSKLIEMLEKRAVDTFRNFELADSSVDLFQPYFEKKLGNSDFLPLESLIENSVADVEKTEVYDSCIDLPPPKSITVIITQYRRNTTEKQLHALFAQSLMYNGITNPYDYQAVCGSSSSDSSSVLSTSAVNSATNDHCRDRKLPSSAIDSIIIYQNEQHVDLSFLENIDFEANVSGDNDSGEPTSIIARKRRDRASKRNATSEATTRKLHPKIHIVHSKHRNFKYHGRFTLPLLIDTEYTSILDDDTIPQPYWLQHAMKYCSEYNAIIGGVGVVIGRNKQFYFNPPIKENLEVDYVGHIWFFKTKWVSQYLFNGGISSIGTYLQPSWEAGEDIGFSASAWLGGRIRTILPPMSDTNYPCWGDSITVHHKDGKQTYSKPIPGKIRWPLTRYWIEHGFIPVGIRTKLLGNGDIKSSCVGMTSFCTVCI